MGLQLAYSAAFVLLAVVRLRPGFRKEGDGGRRWPVAWGRGWRFLPRPECGDDAMLWKERYVSRTSGATKIVAGLIGLAVFGLLAYFIFTVAQPAFSELLVFGYGSLERSQAREELSGYLRLFGTLIYIVWALGTASAASSAIVQEREADTWTSLVSTPLTGLEIVRAKIFGAVWGLRGLGLILLALWLTGLAAGAVHPIGFVAVLIETSVFLWFVAALGVSLSVRAKSSARAMTATVAILIILNGGYMMCCIPMQPNSPLVALGVTPFILPVSLVTYQELNSFLHFNSSYYSHSDSAEIAGTCILGVLAYGIAAGVLTASAISGFDAWIDRPRRGSHEPLRIGPSKPEPDEEIPS
jgi:hypothetical protein